MMTTTPASQIRLLKYLFVQLLPSETAPRRFLSTKSIEAYATGGAFALQAGCRPASQKGSAASPFVKIQVPRVQSSTSRSAASLANPYFS